MLDHALMDWVIAAFCTEPGAEDDRVTTRLVRIGVDRHVAQRATIFVPLAYGREIIRRIGPYTLADHYEEVGLDGRPLGGGALADEPLFSAAAYEAREHAGRDEMSAIATRSAELRAVDSARRGGAAPGGTVSPPVVCFGRSEGATAEARPASWQIEPHDPSVVVAAFLEGHGQRVRREGAQLALAGGLRIETGVFPRAVTDGGAQLQLDVRATGGPLGERVLVESFAGAGATPSRRRSRSSSAPRSTCCSTRWCRQTRGATRSRGRAGAIFARTSGLTGSRRPRSEPC